MFLFLKDRKAFAFSRALPCLLWSLLTFLTLPVSQAQQLPRVIPPSPEASSLFKYLDYPVSNSTGIPDISIPLYEIKSGDLTVPISISYHAGGRKPTDETGAIGLGWTLNCGGMVSRTVYGKPDETAGFPSELKFASNLNNKQDYAYLASIYHPSGGIFTGTYDSEYDIFSYNFNSTSGKFIINENQGGFTLFPQKPIKIDGTSPFPNVITDEKGIIYTFSKEEKAIFGAIQVPTGAYLTNIATPNNSRNIQFQYQTFAKTRNYFNELHSYSDDFQKYDASDPNKANTYQQAVSTNGRSHPPLYQEYLIERLTQINFLGGKVIFRLASSQSDRVKSINILNAQNDTIKKIEFIYSTPESIDGRSEYKLVNLIIKDRPTPAQSVPAVVEKYSFEYYPTSLGVTSSARDLWNYATSGSGGLVPIVSIPVFNGAHSNWNIGTYGSHRNSDINFIRQGAIKKITFPTGGSSEFDYEGNKILNGSTLIDTGGLRIKQIKTNDGMGNSTYKTYGYPSNGGYLVAIPSYSHKATENRIFPHLPATSWQGINLNPYNLSYRKRTYSSEYLPDLAHIFDQPIAYSTITEYQGTVANNTGRIIYFYNTGGTSTGSGPFNAPGFLTYVPNTPQHLDYPPSVDNLAIPHYISEYNLWKTPVLASTTFEENTGTTNSQGSFIYQTKRVIQNNYVATESHKLRGLHLYKYCQFPSDDANMKAESEAATFLELPVFLFADYFISVGKNELVSTVETEYTANGQVAKTTEYTYNSKSLISEIKQTNSSGEALYTRKTYAFELNNPVYTAMTTRNMVDYVVEQHELKNTLPLQSVKTDYKDWGNNLFAPEIVSTRQGNNVYETRLRQKAYDVSGNLLTVAKEKDGDISYIYGYNRAYPIAQVSNAGQIDIAYTSFEADETGNWTINASARTTGAAPTGKRYYALGSGSITKGGLTTAKTYVVAYWTQNTTPLSITGTIAGYTVKIRTINGWNLYEHRITGVTAVTVSGSGNIDELRLYPVDAQMTTYTYDPLIGQTSACDANNIITYYIYDAFGRLSLVKNQNGHILKKYTYQYANQ